MVSDANRVLIPRSAYLHIPFCRRRCYYCDFPVSVVGDRTFGDQSKAIAQYVQQLCQEIQTISPTGIPLETVSFGGGTPSLLSVKQLGQILDTLNQQFGVATSAEISIEIDPATFSQTQLNGYAHLGINRLSLGVQAFQDELLQLCGRTHRVADIYTAVEMIHQADIPNWSLDLISGLPNQTIEQWQVSVEKAIALAPAHVSTYDLIVEPVTPFSRQYQPGVKPLPTDDTTAQMYRLASKLLGNAGYKHYEISNYAKPGYESIHNQVYWKNLPYYGFGMGAASYAEGKRFTRPRTRQSYYEWLAQGGVIDSEPLSSQDILLETLMLGFRLAEGLNVETLTHSFGAATVNQIWESLKPYEQRGWVQVIALNGVVLNNFFKLPKRCRIRFTDPDGFLFSNTILSDLFSQLTD